MNASHEGHKVGANLFARRGNELTLEVISDSMSE